MSEIVECVPNFSEGRSEAAIEAIAEAIRCTDGCHLLDVDPGPSTNRTVYTFVGSAHAVVEGALNAARAAKQYIDMAKHKGESCQSLASPKYMQSVLYFDWNIFCQEFILNLVDFVRSKLTKINS